MSAFWDGVGNFFQGVGQNVNNAIAAPVSLVQGYADIVGSQADMNTAQAAVAASNAQYQLAAAANEAERQKAERKMLVWAVLLIAAVVVMVVFVKIYNK